MTLINETEKPATSIYDTYSPYQFYQRLITTPEYEHQKQSWLYPLDSKLTINNRDYWMFIGGKKACAFNDGMIALQRSKKSWENCSKIRINEYVREIDIVAD